MNLWTGRTVILKGMSLSSEDSSRAEFVPAFFLRELKSAARKGEFSFVETLLEDYETRFGKDAFYAESLSWVARSTASKGFSTEAREYARGAFALAASQLKAESVSMHSPLALAIGTAIEVESKLLLAEEGAAVATAYLEQQLARFESQPFRIRIRKNLHSLALAGQIAPPLDWDPLPGSVPGSAALFDGPCLVFFWSHWCADSRAQARIVARLRETFGGVLSVVAPTRLFGYITKGNPAEESVELAHIQEVRRVDYPDLALCPIPFGMGNFDRYGASTVPTLTGIRPGGKVGFFHAGVLKSEELGERLHSLI